LRERIEAVSPVVATILMVAMTVVLTALLYIMVMGMTGNVMENTRWGAIRLDTVDATTFDLEFRKIEPLAKPMQIQVIIEYNITQARYSFATNGDGDLTFFTGTDICDMTYNDQADDSTVSTGDYIRVSNLPSGGVFTVYILDATTGGMITSKTIDLPG
jgi:flagellin-like protein